MRFSQSRMVNGDLVLGEFANTMMSRYGGGASRVKAWIRTRDILPLEKGIPGPQSPSPADQSGLPPGIEIVAMAGIPAPDDDGEALLFDAPICSDGGETSDHRVYFGVLYIDAENEPGYERAILFHENDRLIQLVRKGDPLEDGETIDRLGVGDGVLLPLSANDSGQSSFSARSGGSLDQDFIGIAGPRGLEICAYTGATLPEGSPEFAQVAYQMINDSGKVAIRATLSGSKSAKKGSSSFSLTSMRDLKPADVCVALSNGGNLQTLLRSGMSLPGINRTITALTGTATTVMGTGTDLNETGQLVSMVDLSGVSGTSFVGNSIVRVDGAGAALSYRLVAASGSPLAGEKPVLVGTPLLNDSGDVAFQATLTLGSGGNHTGGIFLYEEESGKGEISLIAKSGHPCPEGNGKMTHLTVGQVNGPGQIGFFSVLGGVALAPEVEEQLREARKTEEAAPLFHQDAKGRNQSPSPLSRLSQRTT